MADTRAGPEKPRSFVRAASLEPLFWGLGTAALRLPFFPLTEQDIDGANFARAVEHFDIASWAPHPPGYPLLVAAGKVARALVTNDPSRALAVVALASSALLAASVFSVHSRVFDKPTARLATFLLLASPLVTLFAVRPLSDGPGAALAWATLALALRAHERRKRAEPSDFAAALSLATAALLPGVRISALPFALPAVLAALAAARRRWLVFAAGVVSFLVWLVPFLAIVDRDVLTSRTLAHGKGHFLDYGGSALAASDPVARAIGLFRALFAHGLAGLWENRPPATLFATAGLLALLPFLPGLSKRTNVSADRVLAASSGLYLAWIALGQNILEQPRHVLPLVPALLGPLAFAARRAFFAPSRGSLLLAVRRAALVLGAAAAVFESSRLAIVQARYPAPVVRLARFCEEQPDAATLTVATFRFYRWIAFRAPSVRVESVGSIDDAVALLGRAKGRVLVTSDVPGAERLDPAATELRVATDPFVRYVFEDVRLLDLRTGLRAPAR